MRHLEQFLVIAERGSFGAASLDFNLSQPTITRNIQVLERAMGAKLFERSTRGVSLSVAGKKLLPIARSIVDDMERAKEIVNCVSAPGPKLRIGVSPGLMWDLLPQTIDALLAAYPDIEVTVATGTMEWLEAALASGEIDVALELNLSAAGARARNRQVDVEELEHVTCLPFAPVGHPILVGPMSLARLASAHWCMPLQMSLSYRFHSVFMRAGLQLPVQSVNISSIGFVREAVMRWNLLTILPPALLAAQINEKHVVQLDVPELTFGFDACALTVRDRTKRDVLETCLAAMKAAGRQRIG